MSRICHIIGNGESRKLFKDDNNFKIGLNYYSLDKLDLLFAIDSLAIQYLEKNNYFKTPSVISNECLSKNINIIDKVNPHRKNLPFELKNYTKTEASFNVGHCAYLWAKQNEYTEINMWGFDVLFNKSLVSLSDSLFGHTEEYKKTKKFKNKAECYIEIWEKIVDVPVLVHLPQGEKLQTKNKNIIGINII